MRNPKPRPDGYVNITLKPEAVEQLDALAKALQPVLGFEPKRSDALAYAVARARESLKKDS